MLSKPLEEIITRYRVVGAAEVERVRGEFNIHAGEELNQQLAEDVVRDFIVWMEAHTNFRVQELETLT